MRSLILLLALNFAFSVPSAFAQDDNENLPAYLRDRGTGIPTSMFGTYVNKGEFLIYPFYEFYMDKNAEYAPDEVGFDEDEDFRGKARAHEYLIFLAYGATDKLSIEFEAAYYITATQWRSDDDYTAMPDKVNQSGTGDIQMQLNYSWAKETDTRPEFFSYGEIVFPNNGHLGLIGTEDYEFKVGSGLIRGLPWGTLSIRAAVEYSKAESKMEPGEIAVEYLKRVNKHLRLYLGFEGAQDEIECITEAQVLLGRNVFLKINNAFGVTSKAAGWAPEIGIMCALPTGY